MEIRGGALSPGPKSPDRAGRWSFGGTWLLLALAAGGAMVGADDGAAAQEPPSPATPEAPCVAFHLPADHWAARQARRFDRAGLLPREYPGGERNPEVGEVVAAFREAAERLEGGDAFPSRLAEEVRGARSTCDEEAPRASRLEWAEVRVGAHGLRNGLAVGEGGHFDYDGPMERADAEEPVAEAWGAVRVTSRVGVTARGRARGDHLRADELYTTARLGAFDLWAGRRAPGYGQGVAGSLVLSGRVPLDGGGLRLNRGWTMPWILRHLGPLRFQTEAARVSDQGPVKRPWFWASRVSVAPTDWLRLSANRGALIGGEGSPSITLSRLAWILIGSRPKEIDGEVRGRSSVSNQVAAVELELRGRIRGVPVAGSLEWGFEDSSGAWMRQPAILAGLELPVLGTSASSVGIEVADFHSPPRHGVWYRHWHFEGGWADRGRLLGHPLAGTGREIRLHGTHGLRAERARAALDVYRRDRHESNSLAPPLEGTSHGFRLKAVGGGSRLGASLEMEVEHGGPEGRTRAEGGAVLRWYF